MSPKTRQTLVKRLKPSNTPVKAQRLQIHLKNYDHDLADFVIKGFSEGIHLGIGDGHTLSSQISPNHKSALEQADIVSRKIAKEVEKGRYVGPFSTPPFEKFICSPLGLVPKKEKQQFRRIHDLSFPRDHSVNSFIPKENATVEYQNIETVI